MGPYKRGLIVVGATLLILGATSLYFANAVHSDQSTFNVLASQYSKVISHLRDRTDLTGQFRETSGRALNFYIMNSAQFTAFQLRGATGNLYALTNVASGSISYTFTVPDTYYLVFTHGPGLLNTIETVNFQRTYVSLDDFALASGIVLLGLGALEVYWGVRHREPHSLPPLPQG